MHIYSQVLEKLAPHIQQVSMESNGKGVLIDGVPLPFEAGEVGSNHDDSIVDFIRGNMNSEEAAQIPRRTTRFKLYFERTKSGELQHHKMR
ncbi:hypothetical protein HN51_040868 [Arachis hypogaea]